MGLLTLLGSGLSLLNPFGIGISKKIDSHRVDLSKQPKNKHYNQLEIKILLGDSADSDSGLNLSDTKHDVRLSRNLWKVAHEELYNANGNLSGKIYDFMNKYIFSANNLDYKGINNIIKCFNEMSLYEEGEAKKAIETAITVMQHLNDYLIRQSERKNESSSQGFKNYLFGERGVLTQKRLRDMRKASDILSQKENLKEKTNYKVGKDSFDVLNASYTKDSHGKIFVNVNDDNSYGMYTNHGKLYWNIFDKMFDDSEGKIDTRTVVTKYLKKNISNLKNEGKVDYIKSFDWKNNDYRDYAKFNC